MELHEIKNKKVLAPFRARVASVASASATRRGRGIADKVRGLESRLPLLDSRITDYLFNYDVVVLLLGRIASEGPVVTAVERKWK